MPTHHRAAALRSAAFVLVLLCAASCSDGSAPPRPTTTGGTSAPGTTSALPSPRVTRTQMALEGPQTPLATPRAADIPPSRLFAPDNVYRVDLTKAPVEPRSPAMIKHLIGQITPNWNGVAGFNTDQYNTSYYVVDDKTPRQDVAFYDCQTKKEVPWGVHDGPGMWKQVPIPAGAQPANGTDKAMSIYDRSTDQLWEFWIMEPVKKGGTSGWRACWGGRIDKVSTAPGYYDQGFGVPASGLTHVGTMITLDEARKGVIEHAVGLVLIETGDSSRVWYPANRSDGVSKHPDAIPEGARLRLDPAVDVESLPLPPMGKAIAKAAQRYGFLVVDTSGAVAVIGQSGQGEQARTGKDPWKQILGSTMPYDVLKGFPWQRMQVVQRDYGKPVG
ncbi:hypothetical protein [Arsenicicoccus dermatophilus]|uniref:hypothetical protein n=1 Tax=Arsenicicoccus dermatophilus TaxID=1076331 RepID=UPI001F4CFBE4|nr:hypothetical protein [Arsenicicoccus dermatophilus]MCH8612364.1 hypothetical protein [Arsenicicoccus dermatophilus]